MQIRGPTRLTDAFAETWENLWAVVRRHFARYNLRRIHRSLRVTPAMEAGIADHVGIRGNCRCGGATLRAST